MKVLIVNTTDIAGGAARAAYRLHRSLLVEGINSQVLVQSKISDDFSVISSETRLQKGFGKLRPILDSIPVSRYKNRTKTPFSPAWVPFGFIVDRINALNPDIVHLHWVAGGMLRIEDIAKITAPIVWTLHDMWPFTGGCHYNELCDAYKVKCGSCKVLSSSIDNDLSHKVFLRKQKTYSQKKNITVVGLSRWLAAEARSSELFKNNSIVNIPNPIDINVFAPFDKLYARELLNLPKDKKLILFGAMGATSDPRKGYIMLSQALRLIATSGAELVVFGATQPAEGMPFSQKVNYLGQLNDDVSLRALYSAADVMLVPSLQENLSNAIMESLACGTPVVGFDVGGNSDLIEHQVNGYLAKPFSIEDLASGMDWVLQADNYKEITAAARKKVLNNFDSKLVAAKYIDLYKSILS